GRCAASAPSMAAGGGLFRAFRIGPGSDRTAHGDGLPAGGAAGLGGCPANPARQWPPLRRERQAAAGRSGAGRVERFSIESLRPPSVFDRDAILSETALVFRLNHTLHQR